MPFAIFAFNTSFNNQTGFTPFFINHGFEANLSGQISMSLTAQNMDLDPKLSTNSYCLDVLEKFQKSFEQVYKNLNTVSAKHTNIINVPQFFKEGEMVWLFSPVFSTKTPKAFQEFWTGPYTITKSISPVIVYIQHTSKPNKQGFVHVSRLKKKF